MKNVMKKLSFILAAVLLLSILASCDKGGSSTATSGNGQTGSDTVELTWVFGGPGNQKDSEKVWALFNERLQEFMPGTTIKFVQIPYAEYTQKWNLMASSGESMDLFWSNWTMDYSAEYNKGAYYPLSDLIKESAPGLFETIPEFFWNMSKIDGEIFQVPSTGSATALHNAMFLPADLAEKYDIDPDEMAAVFAKSQNATREEYEYITAILEKLKKGGDLRKGINPYNMAYYPSKGYYGLTVLNNHPFMLRWDQANKYNIESFFESEQFKLYIEYTQKWFKNGYIREDIASIDRAQSLDWEEKQDGYAFWIHGKAYNSEATAEGKFGAPVKVIPLEKDDYINFASAYHINTALGRDCKDPVRAIQFLELMNSAKGKELFNLLVFGIEGEHYEKTGENTIRTIDYEGQSNENTPYGLWDWIMGSSFQAYVTQVSDEKAIEYTKNLNETATSSPLMGFVPDLSAFESETSQINAVIEEYYLQVISGASPNVEKTHEEYIAKLKAVGLEKVMAELQSQLDAYIAENNIK